MVHESEILFITNNLNTKWIKYQSAIIKKLFPESEHILIDGYTQEFKSKWPNSWFYWIDEVKKSQKKYYIHIDEDFFVLSKNEVLKSVQKLEDKGIDMLGCSEGYHHFRGANPVALNPFFMIGRVSDMKRLTLDLKSINFTLGSFDNISYSWFNSLNIKFKEEYKKDFDYAFEQTGGSNFKNEHEPFYAFLWCMKELGCKFDYLYPHFDDRFKSTNPRLEKDSDDIGIHMWYTRQWNSEMDVWGLPNIKRYELLESFIKDIHKL